MSLKKYICGELSTIRSFNFVTWRQILLSLSIILCLTQFTQISSLLHSHSDNQGMTLAGNDDAGTAIAVAIKTKWWNDNTWRPYGPLYYRIVHTIAKIVNIPDIKDYDSEELNEYNHHYILLLVSLISIYVIAFLLASLITKDSILKGVYTLLITSSLLASKHFASLLFIAHPDFLFCAFMLYGFICLFNQINNPNDKKYYYLTAIVWGLAASTKMSIILFLPSTLFIFHKAPVKKYIQNLIHFYGLMLITYFLIGFPQNFIFWKVLKFLNYMRAYSKPIDMPFFLGWLNLIYDQFQVAVIFVSGLCLLPLRGDRKYNLRKSLTFLLICIIPFILLISRKMTHAYSLYPIPFGIVLLSAIIIFLKAIISKLNFEINNKTWMITLIFALICTIGKFTIGFIPSSIASEYLALRGCLKERSASYKIISDHLKKGEKVIIDPYMPYSASKGHLVSRSYTAKTLSEITSEVKLIGFSGYGGRFTSKDEPSEYVKTYVREYNADMEKIKEYYNLFKDKELVTGPQGRTWKKIYSDNCSQELWEPVASSK
jgi:hypothetical protein